MEEGLQQQYTEAYWDKFELVWSQVDSNRSEMKEFLSMIEARIKVEQHYSEKLLQLYSPKYEARTSMVGQLMRVYLLSIRKRAEQAKILSSILSHDILSKLKDALDGTHNEFKKLTGLGRAGDKELDRIKETMDKHIKRKRQLEDAQILDFVMSTCKEYGMEKRGQQREKVKDKTADLKEITAELNRNIEEYNNFAKAYEGSMRSIASKFYQLERDRIRTVQSAVMNVNVKSEPTQLAEANSYKNILFEVEDNNKFIHSCHVNEEMQIIIQGYEGKPTGRTELAVFEQQKNFVSQTFDRLNSKQLEQVLQYGTQKAHKQIVEKFFKNQPIEEDEEAKKVVTIARIFTRAWNGQTNEQDFQQLATLMENVFLRKDFVSCMQQNRLMGRFEIAEGCLQCIVKAVSVVLDAVIRRVTQCLASKDGYTGKQIMVLVFTYFVYSQKLKKEPVVERQKQVNAQSGETAIEKSSSTAATEKTEPIQATQVQKPADQQPTEAHSEAKPVEKNKPIQPVEVKEPSAAEHPPSKIYLQHYLKDHKMWIQREFWDSAFIQSVYEQSKQHSKGQADAVIKGFGGVSMEREQNLVFNQLAYYVHNMVLFSIPEKQIHQFASRFIKLYNLDEERSKFIYVLECFTQSNIENTIKEEQQNAQIEKRQSGSSLPDDNLQRTGSGSKGFMSSFKSIFY